MTQPRKLSRIVALALVMAFAMPTLAITAGCGKGDQQAADNSGAGNNAAPPAKPGLSTKQKAVLLAGAALLFYLYKKDQANNAAAAQKTLTAQIGKPQLYRSKNGGVYYRDAQKNPVWLTVPPQGMKVPASEVTPDIQQYQGQPAPPAPAGYRTQSFDQYDPSLAGGQGGPGGPPGPGQ